MTGLDSHEGAPTYAVSVPAKFDGLDSDDLAVRQVRLAEAMCKTFFQQLKLINAVMIELPLGWLRPEPEDLPEVAKAPTLACDEPANEVATTAEITDEAVQLAASDLPATPAEVTAVAAPKAAAVRKPKKARTRKPAN